MSSDKISKTLVQHIIQMINKIHFAEEVVLLYFKLICINTETFEEARIVVHYILSTENYFKGATVI
jgi:hypothetical protein